tara:strand:+ start:2823 stop:4745 length:1923 start_codon:yes stop_codon:yes gene_type:complete
MGCPNCGGPIEMKLGTSWVVVCPWCRHTVMRTDRDLQTLGKVADLVPTAPAHAVGDSGTVGGHPILVGGRVQLDHGRGPWDEWYVQHTDSGHWGWLAQAQGHWYLTYPTDPGGPLPTFEQMQPGQRGQLPGLQGEWAVDERGESTTVSAEGELPFAIVSGQRGRYVDLSGPNGAFATIDYGDGREAPKLFAGRRLAPGELQLQATGSGPRPEQRLKEGQRLRCPTCGDTVPIEAPEITESAVCGSCNSLLDYAQGELRFLKKIEQARKRPYIPLGAKGRLKGEDVTCIGYMERWTRVDGMRFTWSEYLLHTASGYRWLMEDQGHWQWITPIASGDVQPFGNTLRARGRSHVLWNRVNGYVDYVVGEFYWRVEKGETANLTDYIRPPHAISSEVSSGEVVWSASEHIDADTVRRAFGIEAKPPRATGVGIIQPNPYSLTFPAVCALIATVLLLGTMGFVKARHRSDLLVDGPIRVPAAASTQPDASGSGATVTPPFVIAEGPTLVEVELRTNANNQYVGVPAALIEQNTGEVIEFYVDAEYYHGVSGGESWREGSHSNSVHVARVPAGTYALRVDPFWQTFPQPGAYGAGLAPPVAEISVETGATSRACLLLGLLFIWLPAIYFFARHSTFEKKRAELKTV